ESGGERPGGQPAARARPLRAAEGQADRADRRLGGRRGEGGGHPASRGGARPMILVVAEQKDGRLNRASWEAIAGAQKLVDAGGQGPITVAVAGSGVQGVAGGHGAVAGSAR